MSLVSTKGITKTMLNSPIYMQEPPKLRSVGHTNAPIVKGTSFNDFNCLVSTDCTGCAYSKRRNNNAQSYTKRAGTGILNHRMFRFHLASALYLLGRITAR